MTRTMGGRTLGMLVGLTMLLAGCAKMHAANTVGGAAPVWSDPSDVGTTLSSSNFAGKAVYLNLFASWCPPCNDEAPAINALDKRYASSTFTVIGVDVDENPVTAAKFAAKYHLVYPVIADTGVLRDAFNANGNGLPMHIFIRRNGTIERIVVGEIAPKEIEAAIKRIL